MIRRSPLKRSQKPIPRKRKKPRRGPMRDPGYLAFLREEGKCVICAAIVRRKHEVLSAASFGDALGVMFRICDPAHGPVNGRSSKGPDNEAGPLCRWHHAEQTRIGWKTFQEAYLIDWKVEAAAWYRLYQIWKEATGANPE